MTQDTEKTENKPTQKSTHYVGFTDLGRDAETITNLLKDPDQVGISIYMKRQPMEDLTIYWSKTPMATEKDVVKEMRKFLMLISIFQGKAALTLIKDPKKIPHKAVTFEKACANVRDKFSLFKEL